MSDDAWDELCERIMAELETESQIDMWEKHQEVNKLLGQGYISKAESKEHGYRNHTILSAFVIADKDDFDDHPTVSKQHVLDILSLYLMSQHDKAGLFKGFSYRNLAGAYAIFGGQRSDPTQEDFDALFRGVLEAINLWKHSREFRFAQYIMVLDHDLTKLSTSFNHDRADAVSAMFESVFKRVFRTKSEIFVSDQIQIIEEI